MFTRYLLRRFFRLFALVLFSTLFVYVLLDFVGNIKVWLQRDPKDVAEYYLNFVPNIVYLVMPVNLLLSVVGVVGSMARHLEIASMKTAGRSVLRITLGHTTTRADVDALADALPSASARARAAAGGRG